jgi:hypothetical protein
MQPQPWNQADRQSFRDGDRLRASTVPGKRHPGPQSDEWDYDEKDATKPVWTS